MQTFNANEAKNRFGELLDIAQRGSVRMTRRDSVVGAMVSAEEFDAMRRFFSDRLHNTLDAAADAAEQAGMAPEILEELLADEN